MSAARSGNVSGLMAALLELQAAFDEEAAEARAMATARTASAAAAAARTAFEAKDFDSTAAGGAASPAAAEAAAVAASAAALVPAAAMVAVDVSGPWGWTPLMAAAHGGHVAAVAWLLGRGAALGARNSNGMCAVHLAAKEGHLEVLKALSRAAAKEEHRIAHEKALAAAAAEALTATAAAAGAKGGDSTEVPPTSSAAYRLAMAETPLIMFGGLDWKCPTENTKYVKGGVGPGGFERTLLDVAMQAKQKKVIHWLMEQKANSTETQAELDARHR